MRNSIIGREQIANIQLHGEPYQQTVGDGTETEVIDCSRSLDTLAHATGYVGSLPDKLESARSHLEPFAKEGYIGLSRRLKSGEELAFEDAFSVGAFVTGSLNRPLGRELGRYVAALPESETYQLQAVALLAGISVKEVYTQLGADEIAGLAAATLHLDTVVRTPHHERTLAFGGMGGDRGYNTGGQRLKPFSLSTLSAIALAVEGPVHKHHSYPNTSKIAGQSVIEGYGARSDLHTPEAFTKIIEETNLLMSSCHNTRTLHTLSHRLKGDETINHAVGPLAFTMSAETPLQGIIGVNEKIHPQNMLGALRQLDRYGFQSYDTSVAYCGTDLAKLSQDMLDSQAYYASPEASQHVRLDEIAPPPYASLASFMVGGEVMGSFALHPEDFFTTQELARLDPNNLLIPNSVEATERSNAHALQGKDESKARYLAMTIGLGIFVREYAHLDDGLDTEEHRVNSAYLREATARGLEILASGKAIQKLRAYVAATKTNAGQRSLA